LSVIPEDEQIEGAAYLLETWRCATAHILASLENAATLDSWLASAKRDAAAWTPERKASAAKMLLEGDLTEWLFNPEFAQDYRARLIAANPNLPLDPENG
jgi:hypothetical protein